MRILRQWNRTVDEAKPEGLVGDWLGENLCRLERRDDIALMFIEQASDIGHLESVVEEEVANCDASFGLGIEIHAVSRHVKSTRMHLEAISVFMVRFFHLGALSLKRKSKSHGSQEREGSLSIDSRVGAPLVQGEARTVK